MTWWTKLLRCNAAAVLARLSNAQADALQLAGLLLDAHQRPDHDCADLRQR